MKKLLVALSLFIFLTGCITYAAKEDFKNLNAVNEVKLKKEAIYDKVMVFVATQYNSPKKVLEYSDKGQGIVTFNGAVTWYQPGNPLYSYTLMYKMTVNIKDNKYKITMIPLDWIFNTNQPQYGSPIKEMVPVYTDEFNSINTNILNFVSGKNKADDF